MKRGEKTYCFGPAVFVLYRLSLRRKENKEKSNNVLDLKIEEAIIGREERTMSDREMRERLEKT